jgi:hypothetical protein
MVLASLLLLCAVPQTDDTVKVAATSNAGAGGQTPSSSVSRRTSKDVSVLAALPSAPEPKAEAEVEPALLGTAGPPFEPARPVMRRPAETSRQRKIWYGLVAAGTAGAGFDAWTTRRAISSGYGQEANPFLKPFASSNAIYAATQVSPAFMDYLGRRMMVSPNPWVRRVWWIPQVAGTSMSFAAGAHNLGVAH